MRTGHGGEGGFRHAQVYLGSCASLHCSGSFRRCSQEIRCQDKVLVGKADSGVLLVETGGRLRKWKKAHLREAMCLLVYVLLISFRVSVFNSLVW